MKLYNLLFWNIRSVQTQNVFERAMDLRSGYHYSYIVFFEPFIGPHEIEAYKRRIRMKFIAAHCSERSGFSGRPNRKG